MGAFFVAAFWWSISSAEEVQAVFDGDTIKLEDQRIVRLIGINTPELGRRGRSGEAFASASKNRLAELIRQSDFQVSLSFDQEKEDRYGRILAYLSLENGEDPAAHLLSEGLATTLVIPPNILRAESYADIQFAARRQKLKIWAKADKQPMPASELSGFEAGYHVIRGSISKHRTTQHIHWLTLDNKLTVKLTRRDASKYFPAGFTNKLAGRDVEIRGKLYHHKKQQRMKLRHPADITLFR